jgi:hypothetical protein
VKFVIARGERDDGGTNIAGANGGTSTAGTNIAGANGGTSTAGANIADTSGGANIAGNNGGTNIAGTNGGTNIEGTSGGANIADTSGGANIADANGGTNIRGANGGTNIAGNNGGTNIAGTSGGTNAGTNEDPDAFSEGSRCMTIGAGRHADSLRTYRVFEALCDAVDANGGFGGPRPLPDDMVVAWVPVLDRHVLINKAIGMSFERAVDLYEIEGVQNAVDNYIVAGRANNDELDDESVLQSEDSDQIAADIDRDTDVGERQATLANDAARRLQRGPNLRLVDGDPRSGDRSRSPRYSPVSSCYVCGGNSIGPDGHWPMTDEICDNCRGTDDEQSPPAEAPTSQAPVEAPTEAPTSQAPTSQA